MKKWLFISALILVWKFCSPAGEVSLGPGVLAAAPPVQSAIATPVSYQLKGYAVTELAAFQLQAKVLSKTNYYFDRESDISPTDLALGWGRMSDEALLAQFSISQSGRFYRWRVKEYPIPHDEIVSSSANMHLIPANDSVAKVITKIRKGDLISLSGSLVEAVSVNDDWRWRSSLTRGDAGAGACELIWVETIQILSP